MEHTFFSATVLLILITDPLGNIPLFIAALAKVRPERQRAVVLRECLVAFLTLLLFMVFGKHFLAVLRLSDEALRVAGGVILFLIALKMIFPDSGSRMGDDDEHGEPFIVPIAIPLIAGPSAMATVMLIASSNPSRMLEWVGALMISIAVTTVVFLLSTRIRHALGGQVITAMERLMGLVLTAVAIEMLLGGVANYIHHLT